MGVFKNDVTRFGLTRDVRGTSETVTDDSFIMFVWFSFCSVYGPGSKAGLPDGVESEGKRPNLSRNRARTLKIKPRKELDLGVSFDFYQLLPRGESLANALPAKQPDQSKHGRQHDPKAEFRERRRQLQAGQIT